MMLSQDSQTYTGHMCDSPFMGIVVTWLEGLGGGAVC